MMSYSNTSSPDLDQTEWIIVSCSLIGIEHDTLADKDRLGDKTSIEQHAMLLSEALYRSQAREVLESIWNLAIDISSLTRQQWDILLDIPCYLFRFLYCLKLQSHDSSVTSSIHQIAFGSRESQSHTMDHIVALYTLDTGEVVSCKQGFHWLEEIVVGPVVTRSLYRC
jgi:hypothetical protein